jgi:hypothetical protein
MLDDPLQDPVVAEAIRQHGGGDIVTEPWNCDVIGANADLISRHNRARRERGLAVEEKFENVSSAPSRLRDVLQQDLEFLSRGEPSLKSPKAPYLFAEVAAPLPQSEYLRISRADTAYNVILFRSPFLHFIHSGFSKFLMLMQHRRDEGCLEEDIPAVMAEPYSDRSLLLTLLSDLEVFYKHKRLFVPTTPRHLSAPYDYCELVEGARRFLVGHEIGHAHYFPTPEMINLACAITEQGNVPLETAHAWGQEIWCDQFALYTILDIYEDAYRGGRWSESLHYELQNTLTGILLMFALLEFAQIALKQRRTISKVHPPADMRLRLARCYIKMHPLYGAFPSLEKGLQSAWWLVRQIRFLVPFEQQATFFVELWDKSDSGKVSPFVFEAYRAIANNGIYKFTDLLGWDDSGGGVFGGDTSAF